MLAALEIHRLGTMGTTILGQLTVSPKRAHALRKLKLTSCFLVVEDDYMPILAGKYPRSKFCPANRAPRHVRYILHQEQVAEMAKAQRMRIMEVGRPTSDYLLCQWMMRLLHQ